MDIEFRVNYVHGKAGGIINTPYILKTMTRRWVSYRLHKLIGAMSVQASEIVFYTFSFAYTRISVFRLTKSSISSFTSYFYTFSLYFVRFQTRFHGLYYTH
jgi:hypothetical protein